MILLEVDLKHRQVVVLFLQQWQQWVWFSIINNNNGFQTLAQTDQIIIYGHPASRAARNIWMLNELNVSYENVITPFFSKKYDAMNPNRKVPFIQFVGTDGKTENVAVVEVQFVQQ